MERTHHYKTHLQWTGNTGSGTTTYRGYERDYAVRVTGKPDILGSSDPAFRGDNRRHSPEDLFLASISSCHMLWYLHLCAVNKIQVMSYEDHAEGFMRETADGSGHFTEVLLYPVITIGRGSQDTALALHETANRMCFIANSCNFAIRHQAVVRQAE